jgi:hypothetical protein
VGKFVPFALLTLGGGTLGTSVAFLLSRRTSGGTAGPGHEIPPRPTSGRCVDCGSTLTYEEWSSDGPSGSPPSGYDRPLPRAVRLVASGTSPGDQLWVHWLPTEVGHLPVELVGPVPETAFIERPPGAFVPFPEKEPEFSVLETQLLPSPPPFLVKHRPDPLVDEAPPWEGDPPLPRLPIAVTSSNASPLDRNTGGAPPTRPPAGPPPPKWLEAVLAEALNPLPPHLRHPVGEMGPGSPPSILRFSIDSATGSLVPPDGMERPPLGPT